MNHEDHEEIEGLEDDPLFKVSGMWKAMCLELDSRRVAYEVERPVRVTYRDIEIPGQRVDLIVEGLLSRS